MVKKKDGSSKSSDLDGIIRGLQNACGKKLAGVEHLRRLAKQVSRELMLKDNEDPFYPESVMKYLKIGQGNLREVCISI